MEASEMVEGEEEREREVWEVREEVLVVKAWEEGWGWEELGEAMDWEVLEHLVCLVDSGVMVG